TFPDRRSTWDRFGKLPVREDKERLSAVFQSVAGQVKLQQTQTQDAEIHPVGFRIHRRKEESTVYPSREYHASHRLHYNGFRMQLAISRSGVPVNSYEYPGRLREMRDLKNYVVK
ncbi:hypothetical protein, partial [Parapedobacter defluvii]|uniref:hypothetical protein n=1 Tax=Parapedobacter defluvii TaxID=2045106 RepID=UPI0033424DB6